MSDITPLASGSRVQLSIAEEATFATTPTADGQIIRYVSESLQKDSNQVTSDEVDSTRNVTDRKQVAFTSNGDISGEFSVKNLDVVLPGVMGNDFDSYSITSTDISITAATSTISTAGAVDFSVDLSVGMFIQPKGFADNTFDKAVKITSVSATEIVVDATSLSTALVDESAGESVTIAGKGMNNGTALKAYTIEKYFADVSKYLYYNGCIVNSLALSFPTQALVTSTLNFLGANEESDTSTVFTGYTAAATESVVDTSNNIPSVRIDGTSTPPQSFDISIANGARQNAVVGQQKSLNGNQGRMDVTGTMNLYFEDFTEYTLFENNTSFAFDFQIKDTDGNIFVISMPACKATACPIVNGGTETDIIAAVSFGAIKDSTLGYQIRIDQIEA